VVDFGLNESDLLEGGEGSSANEDVLFEGEEYRGGDDD
jgi:hypothetical protein